MSLACRDNKFALGMSDGTVHIYDENTFQAQVKLLHKEPVRHLGFATINMYMASAGRKRICP